MTDTQIATIEEYEAKARALVCKEAEENRRYFGSFDYDDGDIWQVAAEYTNDVLGDPTFGGKEEVLNVLFWNAQNSPARASIWKTPIVSLIGKKPIGPGNVWDLIDKAVGQTILKAAHDEILATLNDKNRQPPAEEPKTGSLTVPIREEDTLDAWAAAVRAQVRGLDAADLASSLGEDPGSELIEKEAAKHARAMTRRRGYDMARLFFSALQSREHEELWYRDVGDLVNMEDYTEVWEVIDVAVDKVLVEAARDEISQVLGEHLADFVEKEDRQIRRDLKYETLFGLSRHIAEVHHAVFGNLPEEEALQWAEDFLAAIPEGTDCDAELAGWTVWQLEDENSPLAACYEAFSDEDWHAEWREDYDAIVDLVRHSAIQIGGTPEKLNDKPPKISFSEAIEFLDENINRAVEHDNPDLRDALHSVRQIVGFHQDRKAYGTIRNAMSYAASSVGAAYGDCYGERTARERIRDAIAEQNMWRTLAGTMIEQFEGVAEPSTQDAPAPA